MATIENVELIDDVRKDALILMKSRPELGYLEAFELAKNNLIGKNRITDYQFKPFTVSIETNNKEKKEEQKDIALEIKDDASSPYYIDYAINNLSAFLNIKDYHVDQIKAYVIAHKMGVDISKFVNNKYNVEQINFLAVMSASGKDISMYLNNYDFVPQEEFAKIGKK